MNRGLLLGSISIFSRSNLSAEEALLWFYILFFVSVLGVIFAIFYIIKINLDRSYHQKCHKEYGKLYAKIEKQFREIAKKVKEAGCHQKFIEKSCCLYFLVEELLAKHKTHTETNNLVEALDTLRALGPIMDEVEEIADFCILSHEEELCLLRWGDEAPIS